MKTRNKTYQLALQIIMSVFTVVEGILLIVQANNLYFSRKNLTPVYSPEVISQYFEPIKIVTFIYIGVIVLGGIASLFGIYQTIKGFKIEKIRTMIITPANTLTNGVKFAIIPFTYTST